VVTHDGYQIAFFWDMRPCSAVSNHVSYQGTCVTSQQTVSFTIIRSEPQITHEG